MGDRGRGAWGVGTLDTSADDGNRDGARVASLALGSGEPGKEIEGPMAIVILGGLVTSTALNLLVLPTLALRYGRFEALPEDT